MADYAAQLLFPVRPHLFLQPGFIGLRGSRDNFQDQGGEQIWSVHKSDGSTIPRLGLPSSHPHQPQWAFPPDAGHAGVLPTPHLCCKGNRARNFESLPLLHLLSTSPDRK